jgi:hypothetical protein
MGLALDSAGNTYVAGVTSSSDFPTTTGAYDTTAPFGNDGYGGFVFKIDPPVESGGAIATATSAFQTSTATFLRPGLPDFTLEAGLALLNAPTTATAGTPASGPGSANVTSFASSLTAPVPVQPTAQSSPRTGVPWGGGEEATDQVFIDWQADGVMVFDG